MLPAQRCGKKLRLASHAWLGVWCQSIDCGRGRFTEQGGLLPLGVSVQIRFCCSPSSKMKSSSSYARIRVADRQRNNSALTNNSGLIADDIVLVEQFSAFLPGEPVRQPAGAEVIVRK